MRKAILPLLLLSAVCVTPASANYFSNPRLGVNLNIGSAPNPTPADLRALYAFNETTTTTTTVYPRVAEAPPPPAPPPPPEPAPVMAAPAPLPAPPPPVAAAPAVRQFMVFFDFDKSALTPESRQVVAEAVNTAKRTGAVRIVVTGHTDTVGSFRYNQALSERRALAVKSEMVRLGMNDTNIVTMGKSFSDPLIATGPGIREPQNRRAAIDLGTGRIASAE